MGLFDWGRSELQDMGVIAPDPATDQGSMNALSTLGSNASGTLTGGANIFHDEGQHFDAAMDGAKITQPLDDEIAADPNHTQTPPPNYWNTDPYYTQ